MERRAFLALAISATTVRSAKAQSNALPIVGFLNSSSKSAQSRTFQAFREGLEQHGFVDGRNVAIEQVWGNGDYEKLPPAAAELVRQRVAVIAAGGPPALRAAKAATATIPIVFSSGEDPVKAGYVASLARPGGNITGISFIAGDLAAKRFDLARELVPNAELLALMVNRTTEGASQVQPSQAAARLAGKKLLVLEADSPAKIAWGIETAATQKSGALLIGSDPFFSSERARISETAAKFAMPTITYNRTFPDSGGLMSYGANLDQVYRQVGVYVGRVLKGEKPADLPVQQPTQFELVVNAGTARALGIVIPSSLLARADEVID